MTRDRRQALGHRQIPPTAVALTAVDMDYLKIYNGYMQCSAVQCSAVQCRVALTAVDMDYLKMYNRYMQCSAVQCNAVQ